MKKICFTLFEPKMNEKKKIVFILLFTIFIVLPFFRCHGMGGNQAWVYNKMDKTLRHVNTARYIFIFTNTL